MNSRNSLTSWLRAVQSVASQNSYISKVLTFNRDARLVLLSIVSYDFALMGVYNVLLNLYLRRLGLGPELIGAMNSVYMASMAVVSVPAGLISSRLGNRITMIGGFSLMVIGSTAACLAGFVSPLVVRVPLYGAEVLLGAGAVTFLVSCTPFMMVVTNPSNRVHAFSVRSVIDGLLAFAGSALGGLVSAALGALGANTVSSAIPFRDALFMVPIGLAFGLVALTRTADDRSRVVVDREEEIERPRPRRDRGSAHGDAAILIISLAASWFLIRCGSVAAITFSNIYMDAGLRISPEWIGTIRGLSQLAGMLAAFFVPFLVARLGRRGCITVGVVGASAGYAIIGLFGNWIAASLGLVLSRLMFALVFSTFLMYGQEILSHRYRSISSGILYGIAGLAGAAVAALGGLAASSHGYRVIFVPAAILMVVGALVFRATIGTRMKSAR